jgi:hypothetical protein
MTPAPFDHTDTATTSAPFTGAAAGGHTLPDGASEDFVGYESTHPLTWLPVWRQPDTQSA